MKLSLRGEYALRALLVLGLNYGQPVVRIQTISDHQNIPKRFLEQILNDLKSAGVVQSKRGGAGGDPFGQATGGNNLGLRRSPPRRGTGPCELRERTLLREMLVS